MRCYRSKLFTILTIVALAFFSVCSSNSKEENKEDTPVGHAVNTQENQNQGPIESSMMQERESQNSGWKETYSFVRDDIFFEPSPSVLKTSEGVAWGRRGNAVEQALLLAELLRQEGEQVRLCFGKLNEDNASLLIGSMFPEKKEFSYANDVLISDPAKDESLIETIRNHCWVQIMNKGEWIDLDPSFPDANVGQTYATLDKTANDISEDSLPKLMISLEVEKSKFRDGIAISPEKQTVWEWSGSLNEALNRLVAVKIVADFRSIEGEEEKEEKEESPIGGVMGGLAGGSKKKKTDKTKNAEAIYKITLMIDNEEREEGRISQILRASEKEQKEEDSITKIQLRFRINNLGGAPIDVSRNLFEKHEFDQEPHYFQRHSILITGNIIPREAWEQDMQNVIEEKKLDVLMENLDNIKSKLDSKKDLKSIYNNCISLEDEVGSQAGHFINLIFASTSDHLCNDFAQALSVLTYYPEPRIIINSVEGTGDEQEVCMDLRLNRKEAIPFPGQAATMSGTYLYGRGVMESTLEGKVIELLTGKQSLTTAHLMQQAADNDIPIQMYSSLEKDSLEALPLPPQVAQKAKRVLNAGHVLIIPAKSIEFDGDDRWGWWDMDPQSGEVVGVLDTGLHQAVIQRTIMDTTGILNDKMALVVGAIVGCVDTHWVLFSLILKYGELNKAALQEAKEYMKMIGSYLCPELDATAVIGVGVSVEIEDCWKKDIGIGLHGGLKIEMGWCQQFAKGFKCASTSIMNYYLMQAE